MFTSCLFRDPGLTLEEVIKRHRAEVLYEDEFNTYRITVRRRHIFEDTLVALCSGFDEKKHLRVSFLGEPAVDGGGPRREFFMLLMGSIANNSSLLDGPPDRRVLRHNTTALQVFVDAMHHVSISVHHDSVHKSCTCF